MHQIVCRLELRPRPHCRSLQRSPTSPGWFKNGAPREREGGRGGGKVGRGAREGRGEEEMGGSPGMPKSRVGKPICKQKSSAFVNQIMQDILNAVITAVIT